MYNIKFKDENRKEVILEDEIVAVDGQALSWDAIQLSEKNYSIIANNKSYDVIVDHIDREKKTMQIIVNNNVYDIHIEEPIDQLLAKMGLDMSKLQKIEPIKAPMPGLILKILVTEGQEIKKGEPVLILEAMKMENIFKAAADAVVKSIKINEKQAVEKGQILIELA